MVNNVDIGSTRSPVIVALDFDNIDAANSLLNSLSPKDCRIKVGKEMFTLYGPDFVKSIVDRGFDVFLDLKFHDIPNTVAKAVSAAAKLGVWMVNVHASGGPNMISAAKDALESVNNAPLLTAVTILTSMDESQFEAVYNDRDIANKVSQLAFLAQNNGADGVVCSSQEAVMLRKLVDKDFLLVTPGIRPKGANVDDQKRIMTPNKAIASGVDYLVIGRPITKADSPSDVLRNINLSLNL
jgi:orotidine-5'-phosphate decarboxylase